MKNLFSTLISGAAMVGCALITPPSRGQGTEFGYFVRVGQGKFIRYQKPDAKPLALKTIKAGTTITTQSSTFLTPPAGARTLDRTGTRTNTLAADSAVYPKKDTPVAPVGFYSTRPDTRANAVQSRDTVYLNYQLFLADAQSPKPGATAPPPTGLRKYFNKPLAPLRDLSLPPLENGVVLGQSVELKADKTVETKDVTFDRKNTYYIKLHDRQAVTFWSFSRELAAMTVPFQYRPGYRENGKRAYGQLNVDANIGAYLGAKFGRITYRYRKKEALTPSKYSFSVGPFVSFSRIVLDKTNTRLATDTANLFRSIGSLSYGGALSMDIADFRVGLFYGRDIALGSRQWDFDRQWWYGFGIGYKLAILSKKE